MPALRARRADARERSLARLGGRRLESAFEPAAPRRLDVRGRGRSPDLPRASALGRGEARRHRPRAAVHRTADATGLHLSSAALRQFFDRSLAAADGPPHAAEGELRRPAVSAPGADRTGGAEAL